MISFEKKLALFSVGCSIDNPLGEQYIPSKYEVNIQAGRALSNSDKYEFVDNCGEDNISDRNKRYSEFTALYWIRRNISAEYIGICHYRRKFIIEDEELDALLNGDIDIISTPVERFEKSIAEEYCLRHYRADWVLFMSILKDKSPEYYNSAINLFSKNTMHVASMGIYRSEIFNDMCDWMFPILDEFYQAVSEKFDVFQNRDVGFIGERMVSLYYEHNKSRFDCMEIPWKFLEVEGNKEDIDYSDPVLVKEKIELDIKKHQISQAIVDLKNTSLENDFLDRVKVILNIYSEEKKQFNKTLFEYCDKSDNICEMVRELDIMAVLLSSYLNNNQRNETELLDYVYTKRFSYVYLINVLQSFGLYTQENAKVLTELLKQVINKTKI